MSRGPTYLPPVPLADRLLQALAAAGGAMTVQQLWVAVRVDARRIEASLCLEARKSQLVERVGTPQGVPLLERRWQLRSEARRAAG